MPPFRPALLLRRALVVAGFNTVLALALTVAGQHGFGQNLLYSQLIGISIWGLIDGGRLVLAPRGGSSAPAMTGLVVLAVLVGYVGGSAAGDLLLGLAPLESLRRHAGATAALLLMSLAAGGFGTYYFTSRELLARARLAQEEAQRQASEARLKLLETQLEPHMLFNTLANLRALIGLDPAAAQQMLDRLNDYLRATLSASRATRHPLAAEFERLRDYLELMAVRMGPRLAYSLDLPDELRAVPVPPLLLQPLVENAIRHGLEPQVAGGRIEVRARRHGALLQLVVGDTGAGLPTLPRAPESAPAGHGGFGLTQVRERLATAFGPQASLELTAGDPRGTAAILQFPLEKS